MSKILNKNSINHELTPIDFNFYRSGHGNAELGQDINAIDRTMKIMGTIKPHSILPSALCGMKNTEFS